MVRRRSHLTPVLLLLLPLVTVLAVAGAGAASSQTVGVAKVPGVGAVLVDGATGRTLYTLTDSSGKAVACADACLAAWPALSAGAGAQATAPKGVRGVATTTDGAVTSKGRPLYLFSGDPQAGTANGNGVSSFGGTWKVVRVRGRAAAAAKAAKAAKPAAGAGDTTTATTNPVEGYGY